MKLQSIIDSIEQVAPREWQAEWDNSGLQAGEPNAEIAAVLLTVDVTEAVMQEAIDRHCDLIISHHPLLFHGLKHLTGATPQERCLWLAVTHHIAIYSAHTNMDAYVHGVSGQMAERIGVTDYRVLAGEEHGLGVIGSLPEPVSFESLLTTVKQVFGAPYLRYIKPPRPLVRTIALCGGAGSDLVETAIAQQAEVYITADWKYHELQAVEGRIGAIDMDHWISEQFTRDVFQALLSGKVTTLVSTADRSPVMVSN